MRRTRRVEDGLTILFFAVFAMPFLGGCMMLSDKGESKILGGILMLVGIIVWVLFGIR